MFISILGNLMEPDWEQFKTETKKQLSVYLGLMKDKAVAKHIILDAFDKEPEHVDDILTTLHIIRKTNNKRETAVAGMLAFLWIYEVEYVACLDAYCYLLTENGHDLFNSQRQKYVHGLKDIGMLDVYTKLKFLGEHNFGLLKREEDEMIRNKIAHHDFIIDTSGKVLINRKEVDVGSKFNELNSFTSKVFETFCTCLDAV